MAIMPTFHSGRLENKRDTSERKLASRFQLPLPDKAGIVDIDVTGIEIRACVIRNVTQSTANVSRELTIVQVRLFFVSRHFIMPVCTKRFLSLCTIPFIVLMFISDIRKQTRIKINTVYCMSSTEYALQTPISLGHPAEFFNQPVTQSSTFGKRKASTNTEKCGHAFMPQVGFETMIPELNQPRDQSTETVDHEATVINRLLHTHSLININT